MSDDRKKSWRELDADRDKSGGSAKPRADALERERDRISKSHAYSSYKKNLDQLFKAGGTELPESMKAKLGPTSEDSKKRRALMDALQKTPNAKTLSAVLDAGMALPDNPRLMLGLLDVRDDALLAKVLDHIDHLEEQGAKFSAPLLSQRARAALTFAEDDEVRARLEALT